MATSVPASLKEADISRFATRASQLDRAKPIIAYYCRYWIVNQILAKGLHTKDTESMTFTTHVMDQLEQFKADNANELAVSDDLAGKAYVEQFGLQVFQKADNAVQENQASTQTADHFQASATFLELLHIWGSVDPEITAKIRYAKFHALRILKAVKAGEDPNLTNPAPEPDVITEKALPPLDPADPEVEMLNSGSDGHRHPTVVEVPDEAHEAQRNLAQRSTLDESVHPSRAPSIPPSTKGRPRHPSVVGVPDESEDMQKHMTKQSSLNESLHPSREPSAPVSGDVSPPVPQDISSNHNTSDPQADHQASPIVPEPERQLPISGNYFPEHVQSPISQLPSAPVESALDLPSAPSSLAQSAAFSSTTGRKNSQSPPIPAKHHGHFLTKSELDSSLSFVPPNMAPNSSPRQHIPHAPPQLHHSQPHPYPQAPSVSLPSFPQTHIPTSTSLTNPPSSRPQQPPAAVPLPVTVDEEAIMAAQKHARWAISALNFEDIPTAVRELKGALERLGVQ